MNRYPRLLKTFLFGWVLCVCLANDLLAQPAPTLAGFTPIYLKQSESLEITLNGANLSQATAALITDPRGLTVELVAGQSPTQVKLHLTATAHAELGIRELRIATPVGVTPPLIVAVGQYAATFDKEPNNAPEQAATLTFPTSIVGRLDVGGDIDNYNFTAKKGQKLVFDVNANRLGSALEPAIAILDHTGREQTKIVSFRQADPALVFDVPTDGAYTFQIRDVQYRGGAEYAYRIDAGELPFVESILPQSGRRGTKVEVRAVGHNLAGVESQTLDLTDAQPGIRDIRFKTPAGLSNDIPFVVNEVAQLAEKGENITFEKAMPVSLPAEVSGVLGKAGEEDFFRFSVPTKQSISIEVQARRSGSPVDALLTLRDSKGATLEQNNGTGEAEARLSRSFEPGDYVVSLRDLAFGGGPNFGYRIHLFPAGGVPADFAVRFMPDSPRLARGGNTRLWCEIVRLNGYKGDVAVSLEGLPAGVTVTGGSALIGESTSGIFTLSADADAALGTSPIKLKAVGTFGAQQAVRFGESDNNGRTVRGTYLSVLDVNPFAVDSPGHVGAEQIAAYPAEAQRLTARLNASSPDIDKAQVEWEAKLGAPLEWKALDVVSVVSAGGAELKKQADGSILHTGGKHPAKDTYTVVASVSSDFISAIRLEMLPDPSLPNSGPGHNNAGNFVLNHLTALIASKAEPTKITPLKLVSAKATFEQPNYAASGAIDNDPNTGWAIFGGTGKAQTAWFYSAKPIPAGDVVLTIVLDQNYGEEHTLGRFRLAVTADPDAKTKADDSIPGAVASALKTPMVKRTPEQKAQVSAYYRTIAPELQVDRRKLEGLRSTVGPFAEVSRLEGLLNASNAGLEIERREWEQGLAAGIGWMPAEVTSVKSASGTILTKEKDDSVLASGPVPPTETYTVVTGTPLRAITAIRLEILSDERLPGNGPGRSPDGNFILTRFGVSSTAKAGAAAGGMQASVGPVPLRDARASFEQANYPLAGALDDKPDSGWAISPMTGRPQTATFFPKVPIVTPEGGAALTFTLEFNSAKLAGYSLGRFRIWVLGAADPATAPNIPGEIIEILKVVETYRTEPQKAEMAAYYRSIAPALEPTRRRLFELREKLPTLPIIVARNKSGSISVPLARTDKFTGPVTVTLEGFSAGRDPANRMPTPLSKNIDATPLALDANAGFGRLTFKVKGNCELGTRMVVLRAEAKVGNDTYVEYSPAFPIRVVEK